MFKSSLSQDLLGMKDKLVDEIRKKNEKIKYKYEVLRISPIYLAILHTFQNNGLGI